MSSQLADGTIFTTCGMVKRPAPGAIPPAEDGDTEDHYVYAAGCLYTEDYVRPLGA